MAMVHLDYPAFVQITQHAGHRHYQVQPLFNRAIKGLGRNFERAVRACNEEVRNEFPGWRSGRSNVEKLQWLAFNPDYRVDTPDLVLSRGIDARQSKITVVTFTVGEHRYGCLPRFDGEIFVAPAGLRWGAYLEYVQVVVDNILRKRRKEAAPDRVDLEPFGVVKGDFVTNLRTTVHVKRGTFDFDQGGASWLFSRVGSHQQFDGATELNKVATDLTHRYPDDLKRALVADDRVERILRVLNGKEPPPTVILGPAGSGRTTLVHEAVAQRLDNVDTARDREPKTWLLDPTRITAGMSIIGQWQRRTDAILGWIQNRIFRTYKVRQPDALYVDNPVALTRVGRSAGSEMALSTVLRPWLEERRFPVILEATAEEWGRIEEEDRSFADLFQILRVQAPPRQRALRIVLRQRAVIERDRGVSFTRVAIARAIELAERYPGYKVLPGGVLDRVARLAARHPNQSIDGGHVDQTFLKASGLRRHILESDKPLPESAIRKEIDAKLIGQRRAVDALVASIQQLRAGLNDPDRPLGSLLFVGPTGVGKTEAAKVLCRYLYDDADHLVRFDMNEFVDAGAASRLIGSIANPEGQLTSRVRHQPFCVLLLDEIEKAHGSVHDLLLQVLDEGRLTDAMGRLVRFNQCVIVLTSNVGAREAGRSLGFDKGTEKLHHTYRAAVQKAFRPEFVNRIDRVVVFSPLSKPDIRQVAELQLARLLSRDGFLRRTTLLRVSEAAMDEIAASGFDARMGARAMKRALESRIVSLVADRVVSLPPEQPVVLEADAVDGVLSLEAKPLPFVERSEHLSPRDGADGADPKQVRTFKTEALTALLERLEERLDPSSFLVASAGPGGVDVEVGDELSIRSEARAMLDVLNPIPGEQRLPEIRQEAIRTRIRPVYTKRRWGTEVRFWDQLAHARIRDYLESFLQEEDQDDWQTWRGHVNTGLDELAYLHYRAGFVGREDCVPGALVVVRTIAGGGADLSDLVYVYRRVFAAHDMENIDLERPLFWLPGGQAVGIPGAGMYEFLRSETGIHLLYPEIGPPVAFQVIVVPWDLQTPKTFPEPTEPEAVVRVYCPPGTAGERGTVSDARTGKVIPYGAFDVDFLQSWLYVGLPQDLKLSLEGLLS